VQEKRWRKTCFGASFVDFHLQNREFAGMNSELMVCAAGAKRIFAGFPILDDALQANGSSARDRVQKT